MSAENRREVNTRCREVHPRGCGARGRGAGYGVRVLRGAAAVAPVGENRPWLRTWTRRGLL